MVSAVAAPKPEITPALRPPDSVREMHNTFTGPTGAEMASPAAVPLSSRSSVSVSGHLLHRRVANREALSVAVEISSQSRVASLPSSTPRRMIVRRHHEPTEDAILFHRRPGLTVEHRHCPDRRDHRLFYVGLPDRIERYPGSPPQIRLPVELYRDHVDSVRFLLGILPDVHPLLAHSGADRLSPFHCRGSRYHGPGRAAILPRGQHPILRLVPDRSLRAGFRHHPAASGRQSLCGATRRARQSIQPLEPGSGVQLPWAYHRSGHRRSVDPVRTDRSGRRRVGQTALLGSRLRAVP